jgi:hypothetical protein
MRLNNSNAITGLAIKGLIALKSLAFILVASYPAWGANPAALYKRHSDPKGRYSLEYPATMNARLQGPDQLAISHPKAPFRIYVFIENRKQKGTPNAASLLKKLAKNLEKELGKIEILDAKSPVKGDKRHGYAIFRFSNSRGVDITQLVHYFVAKDRALQLIISDRSKGYENVKPVVEKVHKSLKIINNNLK